MTDAPAAISATFSEFRMVKTRNVLALVFEVPLEKAAEVFAALGYPSPGIETWCAVARMESPPGARRLESERSPAPANTNIERSLNGKMRYAEATEGEKAVTRAALLAKDPRFQRWAKIGLGRRDPLSENDAATYVRNRCGVASRSDLAGDPAALAHFLAMEGAYLADTGQMAEPR